MSANPPLGRAIVLLGSKPRCQGGQQSYLPRGELQMKSEEVKQLTTRAVEELGAALSAGRTEELTRYLAAMSRFHRYSLHNVMLIALQKPTATHVAGFHTWNKLGRHVRKGEKGIFILAPIVRNKEASGPELEAPDRALVGFRGCAVFDFSQTEGQDLPTIGRVEGDPSRYEERLTHFVATQGIALAYSDDIAPARGISEGGKITLLPGMSPAETFATLAHECAHEMLHRQKNRGETSKRQRETEAEAVAFVVCRGIGLETGHACQNYIQLYRGDAALLMESLESVRFAASRILDTLCDPLW
jgi:antirestriction protein ArdC